MPARAIVRALVDARSRGADIEHRSIVGAPHDVVHGHALRQTRRRRLEALAGVDAPVDTIGRPGIATARVSRVDDQRVGYDAPRGEGPRPVAPPPDPAIGGGEEVGAAAHADATPGVKTRGAVV